MPDWEIISHQAAVGGFVRDAAKQAIADAEITAQRTGMVAIAARSSSREDGSYFLVDLAAGPCMIAATYQGLRCEVLADIGDVHQDKFRMIWLDLELPAEPL